MSFLLWNTVGKAGAECIDAKLLEKIPKGNGGTDDPVGA
jgi:hypothetical protein